MRLLNILSYFTLNFVVLASTANAGNFDTNTELCSSITTNGVINISSKSGSRDGNGDYLCLFTPSSMRINLYEIRLCETYPDDTNYTDKCEILVQNPSGKLVEVSNGLSTSVTDNPITLAEGTYTYATVLVSPTIESKFSLNFDSTMQGANGTGTTCWTNGKEGLPTYLDGHDEMTVNCGAASAASPIYSPVYFYAFWDDVNSNFTNRVAGLAGSSLIDVDAFLMNDATTPMPMSGLQWLNGDPNTGVVIGNTATRLLGVSQVTPIVISGSTKNIDIGFSIEDTYYAKTSTNSKYRSDGTFDGGGAPPGNPICSFGGTEACLLNAAPERFIFKATAN